jgi:hypothetical protein
MAVETPRSEQRPVSAALPADVRRKKCSFLTFLLYDCFPVCQNSLIHYTP